MPPQKGGFFRGGSIGEDEVSETFARGAIATTLSEGSFLRVSELPDTNESHLRRGGFFLF